MLSIKLLVACIGIVMISKSEKDEKRTPPGTIKLNDNYYVDKTEVSNFSWLEYLSWLERKHGKESKEYSNAFPDSLAWSKSLVVNCPSYHHYLKNPSFKDYPVIGVNKQQALAFCNWRTERVNEYFYIQDNKLGRKYNDSIDYDYPKVFEYKLPTQEQWIEFSQTPYDEKILSKVKKSSEKLSNYMITPNKNSSLQATDSYYPNEKGLYNVFGNVAEMVEEDNLIMGGSWNDSETECKLKEGQKENNSNSLVGFRCIAYRVNGGTLEK